jgi:acid phosphatase
VVENHSLDQMRADMPFTAGLAQTYGYASHYQALTHPSLPNYLAMTGGSTYGVTDDGPPSVNGTHEASVFGRALALGRTAGLYAEGMPGNCALTDGGTSYAVKHNPWAYHLDERASCDRYDVPLTELPAAEAAGRLPDVGMVIPDLCHDAHDCGLDTADAWLRDEIGRVMSGPDWKSGRLAIVITADEDDRRQDNLVLTVVMHPGLHGVVVDTPLTHYDLAGSYLAVIGDGPLANASPGSSLLAAFGVPVSPATG